MTTIKNSGTVIDIRIGELAAAQPLSGTQTVSRVLINGVSHSFFIRPDMKKAS